MSTKNKLLAYQISGQTIGVNIQNWNGSDLNGNEPFMTILSVSTIPIGYIDISSIENWNIFGITANCDYMKIKYNIVNIVNDKNWSGLTNNEKDIVIKYFAYINESDPFLYLVYEKGLSFEESKKFLVESWYEHHKNLIDCYKYRWSRVKLTVATYLSFADAQDLFNHTNLLIYSYTEAGIVGKNYGDNVNGIMDFIESTNIYENNGLVERNYSVYGNNWNIFIDELKNILIHGCF